MNDGWIEWVWSEEKPYPETLETLVYIKCLSDGYEETYEYDPDTVKFWQDATLGKNVWEPNHYGSITHYKLAEGN